MSRSLLRISSMLALMLVASLALAGAASAATRYATATPGTTPNCSQAKPCDLATAVTGAADGDTVIVAGGTYTLAATLIDPAGTDVTIEGTDPQHRPVITGPATGDALDVLGAGSAVSDLELRVPAANTTGAALRFDGLTADRILASGPAPAAGGTCQLSGEDVTLSNSVCTSTGTKGAGVYVATDLTGTSTTFPQQVTIANVTALATGTTSDGIHVFENTATSQVQVTVTNTIARGVHSGIFTERVNASATNDVFVDHSNFSKTTANTGTSITLDSPSTNQTTAPSFDASGYHQVAGSPTIGQGVVHFPFDDGPFDIDGDSRVLVHNASDDTIDIGADQFVPPPSQRYASPTGTNHTTCPSSSPCSLIDAVGGAQSEDDIIVGPGTYDLLDDSLFVEIPLHIQGQSGAARPIITSSQESGLFGTVEVEGDGSTLSGLDIRATGSSNAIALNVDAVNAVADGVLARGSTGCHLQQTGILLRDSVCVGTAQDGAGLEVDATAASDSVRNVTAVGRGDGVLAEDFSTEAARVELVNVIARGGVGHDVHAESDQTTPNLVVTAKHVNYATTTSDGQAGVTIADDGSKQAAAPVFFDPANLDFHEAAGSPTLGAGLVEGRDAGSTDIDGDPRPTTPGLLDIGADQATNPPQQKPQPTDTPPGETPPGQKPPVVTPPTTTTPVVTTPAPAPLPAVSKASIAPSRFAVLAKGHRAKHGVHYKASVRFTLTTIAQVRATALIKTTGRKVGKSCKKQTSKNRKGRACTLWVKVGTAFANSAKAGTTTVTFAGKIGKRALKPGTYELTLVATDAAKRVSKPKTISFKIVRG